MSYDMLKFKAYATKDLNKAAARFKDQTGKDPKVFVVRGDWTVYGSKENMEKVLISRFGGYACVSIPIDLGRREIEKLSQAKRKHSISQKTEITPDEERIRQRMVAYTRYCNYCGRFYGTDPVNVVIHCGAPRCVEAHNDWTAHRAEIKRLHKERKKRLTFDDPNGSDQTDKEIIDVTPEFSLDDPYNATSRGWVYLIEAENGLYKIGRSDNIEARFAELVCQSPVKLWLTHTIYCTDYKRAESWLHQQFHKKRDHGEWFWLSGDEVEWLIELRDYALDNV